MPVVFQTRIVRADLQANPKVMYLFGDNDERRGKGGQAKEMRGEPNAVGIRTKKAPHTGEGVYYTDEEFAANVDKISDDFATVLTYLKCGGVVVIPSGGLGTGLAELKTRAPETLDYIKRVIAFMKETYDGSTNVT